MNGSSHSASPALVFERRHDLDALRAIAMLLGILLHGLISFLPDPGQWPIQDTRTSEAMRIALAAIHGFRMPLFFLISGYFTAMLWRRRGLAALAKQRFRRIFLPLVASMFTIIPLMWSVHAVIQSSGAAVAGDVADPTSGESPSIWIQAARGDADAVQRWLDNGGDVGHAESDGSTALHAACLFGRVDVWERLIEAGGDPKQANQRGEDCTDMLLAPWGITQYVAEIVDVKVNRSDVIAGRQVIAGRLNMAVADSAGFTADAADPWWMQLLRAPLLAHLWFLWFLCWLVTGFIGLVGLARAIPFAFPLPTISPKWVLTPRRYVYLLPVTAFAQWWMSGEAATFGPATSISLLPLASVLLYYALFFGFGAIWFHHDPLNVPPANVPSLTVAGGVEDPWPFSRHWPWLMGACGLVVLPLGLAVSGFSHPVGKLVYAFVQSAYAWGMSFGAMGFFSRWCRHPSATMRYLSDGSYWMYLIHLPIIWLVQDWVRDWSISPWAKLLVVCLVTSMALVVSYQILVRYTFLGSFLNGRRRKLVWKSTRSESTSVSTI